MSAINKILRGRYRIVSLLGQGETGAVYEAYDNVRDTNVALKEILIDLEKVSTITQQETLKHAFANQAKILAKVKHESLPQLRGYFSEIDRHYLVMDLVDGEDVSEMLAKGKNSLSPDDVTNWADQLLDALDYLHTFAPPIIHRNIKPQNVKLTLRGKIKLLGFDITEGADARMHTVVTNRNSVSATLHYSPLEQILRVTDLSAQEAITKDYGERLEKITKQGMDARSDIYALGATLYHLLTARLPIDALERALDVWAEIADPLPTANQINPIIPPEVSEVLAKAMEIERENRFASAMEMRRALQTAVAQAKEREAEAAKKKAEESARETLLVEEKKLEQERQRVEQERLKIEAEQKRQADLIAQQLKEAEAQRIEAEKRAAEAEKRLLEKETKNADAVKSAAAGKTSKETKSSNQENSFPNKNKSNAAPDKNLFAEPTSEKKSSMMIPVAVVAVLLIVGVIAGVFLMRKSNAAESKQAISSQTVADKPASEAKIETPTTVNATPETSEAQKTALPSSFTETPTEQPTVKNKPAAQPSAPRVEKQPAPPQIATKATPKPKKTVTVDDLIGGN